MSVSQKGVIGHIIQNDADVPYMKMSDGTSIMPDIIITPHFIKQQALYIFTNLGRDYLKDMDEKSFRTGCFQFRLGDMVHCLEQGKK